MRFASGRVFYACALQWAPTLAGHDPNPPLPLETLDVNAMVGSGGATGIGISFGGF